MALTLKPVMCGTYQQRGQLSQQHGHGSNFKKNKSEKDWTNMLSVNHLRMQHRFNSCMLFGSPYAYQTCKTMLISPINIVGITNSSPIQSSEICSSSLLPFQQYGYYIYVYICIYIYIYKSLYITSWWFQPTWERLVNIRVNISPSRVENRKKGETNTT